MDNLVEMSLLADSHAAEHFWQVRLFSIKLFPSHFRKDTNIYMLGVSK